MGLLCLPPQPSRAGQPPENHLRRSKRTLSQLGLPIGFNMSGRGLWQVLGNMARRPSLEGRHHSP
jgi:hypothetical protein